MTQQAAGERTERGRSSVRWPTKAPVVGVPISMTSYEEVLSLIERRPANAAMVGTFCNVHSVMSARRRPALARAIANADVATSDGIPLVWALRATANRRQTRVYGPDLMHLALVRGVAHGWKHFFFGTTPETLGRLTETANEIAPGVRIVGVHAPPFRPLTTDEEEGVLQEIRGSGADIVWVGLGMPKQELWMDRVRDRLPGIALLGVGAAFDLLSGTVPQAPAWMQRIGLEWFYRLMREPRRLWRRYLWNNPAYLILLARQIVFGPRGGGPTA